MQLKTFSTATNTLTFDDVVPKLTSTPHVAAAAFYHCLGESSVWPANNGSTDCRRGQVLATKDHMSVAQDEPYATLSITVK